jgi:hypothetical protein
MIVVDGTAIAFQSPLRVRHLTSFDSSSFCPDSVLRLDVWIHDFREKSLLVSTAVD